MDKIGKVWLSSIFIFFILAILWAINFPAICSIPLDQSADKALVAGNVTIVEKDTRTNFDEADIKNTITCSNLNTFIEEIGNGIVIKGIVVWSGLERTEITTTYLYPRLAAKNSIICSKPMAVVKYVAIEVVPTPNYYEGRVKSISAGEVKLGRNVISMFIGVVVWTIIFAILSGILLLIVRWLWVSAKKIRKVDE